MRSADTTSRDRLLDVALELFASRGYAATSTAEIQKASGMSPGSGALYRHFRSKSAVLLAALSYLPVMQVLLGHPPGDMDPERFRDAWLRLSRAVFTHGVPTA